MLKKISSFAGTSQYGTNRPMILMSIFTNRKMGFLPCLVLRQNPSSQATELDIKRVLIKSSLIFLDNEMYVGENLMFISRHR